MIHINTYLTELECKGKLWSGPDIKAKTWKEAQEYINKNGLGYLTIVGKAYFGFYMFEFN